MKPSFRKLAVVFLGAAALGALAVAGFYSWRSYVMASQEKRCFADARSLLAQSRPLEALSIIRMMKGTAGRGSLDKWMPLEIKALEQSRNIHRLLYLYSQYPMKILGQEKASILVGRALLGARQLELFAQVRSAWRAREKSPELWFALDVDALLAQGKRAEALELLESRSFKGAADSCRLVRLAMLKGGDNLDEAWKLLEEAFRADPRNADVRSFRAQVLESGGNIPSARMEYVAALLSDPGNPLLRDQLAEFYRRQGACDLALKTWIEGMTKNAPDFLWIKALFWSKVARPAQVPRFEDAVPSKELAPLIRVVQGLKPGIFWDDRPLQEEVSIQKLAQGRQEIFWLKLIQALKDGSEARAMEMLKSNPFRAASFNPDLEKSLQVILVYRRWGIFVGPGDQADVTARPGGLRHQFFEQLDGLAGKGTGSAPIPPKVEALLKSDEAFGAAFLAAGWMEAALGLNARPVVPEDLPDWVSYGYTQALRHTRGNRAAFDYARKQKATPELQMLQAEILLADSQADKAIPRLQALARSNTDVGFRAAWLLSLANLSRGDLQGSRAVVEGHKTLSGSLAGREILARIAYDEGNVQEADRLYRLLADRSIEAKAYLARRAFEQKDYAQASRITEELIRIFPDMLELRENLVKIRREESRGKS